MQRQNGTAVFKTPVARSTMSLLVDASEHMPLYDERADMPLYDEQMDMPYDYADNLNTDTFVDFNATTNQRPTSRIGTVLCLNRKNFERMCTPIFKYAELTTKAKSTTKDFDQFWTDILQQHEAKEVKSKIYTLRRAYKAAMHISLSVDRLTLCIKQPHAAADTDQIQTIRNSIFLKLNSCPLTFKSTHGWDDSFWTQKIAAGVTSGPNFAALLNKQLSAVEIDVASAKMGFDKTLIQAFRANFPKPANVTKGKKSKDSMSVGADNYESARHVIAHPKGHSEELLKKAREVVAHQVNQIHAHLKPRGG